MSDHWMIRDGVGASRVFCPDTVHVFLLDFLCVQFKEIGAETWAKRLATGSVLNASGVPFELASRYPKGETVYYFRQVASEKKLPYLETVLFQDEHLVIADKPHFLPVIPSGQYVKETLLVRLKQNLGLPYLAPMHRIDRDTAGLVAFMVKPNERAAYHGLFSQGKVTKHYQAIAAQTEQIKSAQLPFEVASRIVRAENFMQMRVTQGLANAFTQVESITALEALEYPEHTPQTQHLARYHLKPLTGKRHQLRVHMQHLGAPIVGDCIYPTMKPERDVSIEGHPPLQLLAEQLAFVDPITGNQRHFRSKLKLQLTRHCVWGTQQR